MSFTKLNSAVCQLQNIKWTQLRSLKDIKQNSNLRKMKINGNKT